MITVRILLWGCELCGVSHWDAKCRLCWRLCCPRIFWRRARSSDSLFRYIRWVVTTHVLSFLSFDVVVRLHNVQPGVVRRKGPCLTKLRELKDSKFLGLHLNTTILHKRIMTCLVKHQFEMSKFDQLACYECMGRYISYGFHYL